MACYGPINSKSLLNEWAHIQSCGQKVIYIHLHSTMHLFTPPPPPTQHTHKHTKHSQQGSRLSSRMPSGCTQIINSPILLMLFYSLIDSERQSRTKQYILRCKVFLSWFALFFQSCLQSLSSDK